MHTAPRLRRRGGTQGLPVWLVAALTLLAALGAPSARAEYCPSLGRFLQPDPFGTGIPLDDDLRCAGWAPTALSLGVAAPSPDAIGADGPNRFVYLAGAPHTHADPTGLFIGLLGPTSTLEFQSDHAQDTLDRGRSALEGLRSLLERAAIDQLDDTLWARSWRRSDDDWSGARVEDEQGGGAGELDGLVQAGWVRHHIATNKNWKRGGKYSHRFKALFDRAGMSLNDKANLMVEYDDTIHRGPHSPKYHEEVLRRLSAAVKYKRSQESVRRALERELDAIRDWLRQNPYAIRGEF